MPVITAILAGVAGLWALLMAVYALPEADIGPGAWTVVVLGAQTQAGEPSPMLARRLDKAAELLLSDEGGDFACVVSGGAGSDTHEASVTEAAVMKRYLEEKGVAPERIYPEEQSRSTKENLRFSLEMIKARGLPDKIIIVTDSFHQPRARIYAKKLSLEAVSVSSKSPPPTFIAHSVREMAGMIVSFFD